MRSMSGEGVESLDESRSPHPNPLPNGEREQTGVMAGIQVQTEMIR